MLDIGCGSGATTREAARRASGGSALGIDLSSPMLELAARRAEDEGVDNVAFVHGDAQVYPFASDEFSVAISRSGAMFFADPVAAFTNIGRALRADGRLMLMVWQSIDRNHWIRDLSAILTAGRDVPAPPPGAPGPLSLADPDRVDALLSASGFHDIALADVAAPMCFGATADDAFRFVSGMGFVQFMLKDLDDSARAYANCSRRHASAEGVCYDSAAWLVNARSRASTPPHSQRAGCLEANLAVRAGSRLVADDCRIGQVPVAERRAPRQGDFPNMFETPTTSPLRLNIAPPTISSFTAPRAMASSSSNSDRNTDRTVAPFPLGGSASRTRSMRRCCRRGDRRRRSTEPRTESRSRAGRGRDRRNCP